jgi:PIN domain nuclease of toxin-antitoxin system
MKLLLDTNVFIWLNDSPQRVDEQVMSILANPDNDLFLSLTSLWEMQIKIQLGKLQLSDSLPEILKTQQVENNLELLRISLEHVLALESLPHHHKDPFDQLVRSLTITQLEALGDALLDFSGMADLAVWFEANSSPN